VQLVLKGYEFSLQFEKGGVFEGKTGRLYNGWVLGRSVVRLECNVGMPSNYTCISRWPG